MRSQIIEMGEYAKTSIDLAIQALQEQNVDKANEIIERDAHLNKLEGELNENAISIITKQQPVAKDLRKVMGAIKVASDIERIGDISVNIAKSVIIISKTPFVKPIEDIPRMAQIALSMLTDIMDAYKESDHEKAYKVAKKDDEVDKLYGVLVKELIEIMTKKPESIEQATQLAFICRYIERAGDHVTNIAESILFVSKGERLDLNL